MGHRTARKLASMHRLKTCTVFLSIALAACAPTPDVSKTAIPVIQGSNFTPQDLAVPSPAQATVIIYSHGTSNPRAREDCTRSYNRVPDTLAKFDGGPLHVFRHCSHAVERSGRSNAGNQVYARVRELTGLIDGFVAAGVPANRIVLAGHSNGGWSSLMLDSGTPSRIAGVIAFAPAFAGKRSEVSRFPWWRREVRPRQVREMTSGGPINALIFGYKRDPFNRPKELRFLPEAFPNTVQLVAYGCPSFYAHNVHLNDCQADQTEAAIRAFLDRRIGS